MESNSFSTAIIVAKSAKEIFSCIKKVPNWWSNDFEGYSSDLNDEFIIHHPNAHFSKQKLVEVIPEKKIVWLVTESRLYWLQNQDEWTNTKMIFEIGSDGDKSVLCFTHEGLIPGKECYERCTQGWTMVIKERLFDFITNGKTI
jgi:hypothetical protein